MRRGILERDAEVSVLAGAMRAAADSHGSVALVMGEAGIGKSSLVAALRSHLPAEGRMLVGYCDDLATPRTLGPFRDLVGSVGTELSRAVTDGSERDRVLAAFAVADAVRAESADAVRQLQQSGIEVVMMTGDARSVADAVAHALGIDTVLAQVLPQDKAAHIERLQQQGRRVAMVGDGVNDAPALATADVGIAIGAGTDVAVEAGDIVLVRSDPRDVPRIVELSRASYRKMVQNLWWATGYNVVAIPVAAGVLAPWGVLLSPAIGAMLMSISTLVVAINAQLLRRAKL